MLDFTFELSKSFSVLPFEVFKQDKDEVILLINYLIEKSEMTGTSAKAEIKHEIKPNSNERIRVNDKTATGGWY